MRTTLPSILIAMACLVACSDSELVSGNVVVLSGATIVDGTGAEPMVDAAIVIDGERISRVAPRSALRFTEGLDVRDVSGRWIIPGLIDTHAHMPEPEYQEEVLATLLAFGITTVRSPHARPETGIELRDRLRRGEILGPALFTTGRLIDGPATVMGDRPVVVRNAFEIRAEVRRQAASGVDYIKLLTELSPDLVRAAIEEAHALGLPVLGHLGRTTWTEAIGAGIDGFTHGWYAGMAHSIVPDEDRQRFAEFFMPNRLFDPDLFDEWRTAMDLANPDFEQVVAAMADRGVEFVPNLVMAEVVTWGDEPATLELLEPAFAPMDWQETWSVPHSSSSWWPSDALAEAKLTFPVFLDIVRLMHQRGVLVTAGTDLNNAWITPGVSYHRELALLSEAGISNLDIITIATGNGAQGLRISEQTGTIAAGKLADLVVLTADPLESISNSRRIERVFLHGRELTPGDLLAARSP